MHLNVRGGIKFDSIQFYYIYQFQEETLLQDSRADPADREMYSPLQQKMYSSYYLVID